MAEKNQAEEGPAEEEDAVCCEFNVSYADDIRNNHGEEWVQCACGRWIHEKCIDEVIIDGKECLVMLLRLKLVTS